MNKDFVEECIKKAKEGVSKCTKDILNLEGMTGSMTRHLYNNLCSFNKGNNDKTRYLEIGCYKGSSTISALYGNDCQTTVIDNWSEFGGPKDTFYANMQTYFKDIFNDETIQVINENSFDLKTKPKFRPYDIYLYDGNHSEKCQEEAITYYWEYLADPCVILIDDWDWDCAKNGTLRGLEKVNANILHRWDIHQPGGSNGFWNGCGVFLVSNHT